MSKQEKDGLMDCLFSGQDHKLVNLKFFRGTSDLISEEDFRDELCSAEERKRLGAVKKSASAPRCKKPRVDLRKLVAEA